MRVLLKVIPGSVQQERSARLIGGALKTSNPKTTGSSQQHLHEALPHAPYHEGQRLIDAYFAQVHVFAPLVHEPTFRSQFLTQSRADSPWMALLYMVFALGSVASSTSDSEEDLIYYRAAQAHLGLESFGSGQMETLQALILMGGLYLHYRNRPNMASAIMGAVTKIAFGLGLHRGLHDEFTRRRTETEIKRRTWWCIFALDSWGSITLGRPHTAVNKYDAKLPGNFIDDQVISQNPRIL